MDYLQLSQHFHTIIIRDIPRLNQSSKGQARRFITLVDTLYDNKVSYYLLYLDFIVIQDPSLGSICTRTWVHIEKLPLTCILDIAAYLILHITVHKSNTSNTLYLGKAKTPTGVHTASPTHPVLCAQVRLVCSSDVAHNRIFEKWSPDVITKENLTLMDDLGLAEKAEDTKTINIFTGEEEMFACDRTVSRLTQMMTEEYWQAYDSVHR